MAVAGPATDGGSDGAARHTAAQALEPRPDERDLASVAPRTPSPWDADADLHPVLERFKRVRLPVSNAVLSPIAERCSRAVAAMPALSARHVSIAKVDQLRRPRPLRVSPAPRACRRWRTCERRWPTVRSPPRGSRRRGLRHRCWHRCCPACMCDPPPVPPSPCSVCEDAC